MAADHPILQDMAVVLGTAALTTVVFRRLRQPVVLGYLLAGLIVGPHVPVPLVADPERVERISELGVILVMFSIGLEFSLRRLLSVLPLAGLVGVLEIATLLWLGYAAAQARGWSPLSSAFAGAMVAISSTMIVAKTFEELSIGGRLKELVLGVLVLQDLAAVVLLAVLTGWSTGATSPEGGVGRTLATLAGFLVGLVVVGELVVPRLLRWVAGLRSSETLLVTSIGLCFGLALLAQRMGYSVALGAFFAGSLAAESGLGHTIERLVRPLRDVFAGVFFVSVGMLVEPAQIAAHWPEVLIFTGVVLLGQLVSVTLGAFLAGNDVRTALRAGMSLAQIGEFSFIMVAVGVGSGAVEPALLPVAVSVSALTAFLTPWLVGASASFALWVDARLPHPVQNFASLYGAWLERLRETVGRGSAARRLVLLLALDGALLTAAVIVSRLAYEPLVKRLVDGAVMPERLARLLVIVVTVVVDATLVLGLVRTSRRLALLLGERVLPTQAGHADFAAAPRRSLVVTLQLGLVLAVLLPVTALTQPFVPVLPGASAVVVALAVFGFAFWKSATELQAHTRAGAHVLLDAIARPVRVSAPDGGGALEADGYESGAGLAVPTEMQSLYSGIGSPDAVRIARGALAAGRTLADLDLRGLTGATAIGIRREGRDIVAPLGRDRLQAGDMVALSGTHAAIDEARKLLEQRSEGGP